MFLFVSFYNKIDNSFFYKHFYWLLNYNCIILKITKYQNKKLSLSRSCIRNFRNHEFMSYPNISFFCSKHSKTFLFLDKCKKKNKFESPPSRSITKLLLFEILICWGSSNVKADSSPRLGDCLKKKKDTYLQGHLFVFHFVNDKTYNNICVCVCFYIYIYT